MHSIKRFLKTSSYFVCVLTKPMKYSEKWRVIKTLLFSSFEKWACFSVLLWEGGLEKFVIEQASFSKEVHSQLRSHFLLLLKNKLCVFLLSRERCKAVKMLHFRRAINAANLAFYIYGKIRTQFEINPSIIFKLPKKIPGRVKFNFPF